MENPFRMRLLDSMLIGKFRRVALPPLEKGENFWEVTLPFEKKETVEWCYLLGNFGVSISEDQKILVPLPEKLSLEALIPQGFPFTAVQ